VLRIVFVDSGASVDSETNGAFSTQFAAPVQQHASNILSIVGSLATLSVAPARVMGRLRREGDTEELFQIKKAFGCLTKSDKHRSSSETIQRERRQQEVQNKEPVDRQQQFNGPQEGQLETKPRSTNAKEHKSKRRRTATSTNTDTTKYRGTMRKEYGTHTRHARAHYCTTRTRHTHPRSPYAAPQ
jgi:hypothetical protein